MKHDRPVEENVRSFYEGKGWDSNESGTSTDAQLWEDLRTCARDYVSGCRLKIIRHLPRTGERLLDAASVPEQPTALAGVSRGGTT